MPTRERFWNQTTYIYIYCASCPKNAGRFVCVCPQNAGLASIHTHTKPGRRTRKQNNSCEQYLPAFVNVPSICVYVLWQTTENFHFLIVCRSVHVFGVDMFWLWTWMNIAVQILCGGQNGAHTSFVRTRIRVKNGNCGNWIRTQFGPFRVLV